jgi:hypothetical protein
MVCALLSTGLVYMWSLTSQGHGKKLIYPSCLSLNQFSVLRCFHPSRVPLSKTKQAKFQIVSSWLRNRPAKKIQYVIDILKPMNDLAHYRAIATVHKCSSIKRSFAIGQDISKVIPKIIPVEVIEKELSAIDSPRNDVVQGLRGRLYVFSVA